jgi:hypothetical protein
MVKFETRRYLQSARLLDRNHQVHALALLPLSLFLLNQSVENSNFNCEHLSFLSLAALRIRLVHCEGMVLAQQGLSLSSLV